MRRVLSDGSGTDTINAAAVTGDSVIDLTPGTESTLAGNSLSIASGATIENVFAGDGDDRITGNAVANTLSGGRGADTLTGGSGNDELRGGTGDDVLDGGADGGDVAWYSSIRAEYTIEVSGGTLLVSDSVAGRDGSDSLLNVETLRLTDGDLATSSYFFAPPTASDDAVVTLEDTAVSGNVLTNDSDPNGDTLTVIASVTLSAQGALVTVGSLGGYSYDPTGAVALQSLDLGQSATDSFSYTISDGTGGTDTATVTVSVIGVPENAIVGTAGDDALTGTGGDDVLFAWTGSDTLSGGLGDDRLIGGQGDDVYEYALGGGGDRIEDGGGSDRLMLDSASSVSSFGWSGADLEVRLTDGSVVTVVGQGSGQAVEALGFADAPGVQYVLAAGTSSFADLLVLTDGRDKISGWHGDDWIFGGGGQDYIWGNAGTDTLVGEGGNDQMFGGHGDDVLVYDAADTLLVDGGEDVDTLRIDGSGEALNLTQVADSVYLNLERIDLTGTGDNSLTLSLTDLLALGDGSNTLTVIGDAGDTVAATDGGWVSGGALDVGGIFYDSYSNDIATLLVDQAIDQSGVQEVVPEPGVVLTSTAASETLIGGLGDDTYNYALGGGDDRIEDGGGSDRLVLDSASSVSSFGWSGADLEVRLTDGSVVTVVGQGSGQAVEALGFADAPGVQYVLAAGTSSFADFLVLTDGRDKISGWHGDDWIFGGGGQDYIWGNAGPDTLVGEGGNDQMFGGHGDDILIGGQDHDRLVGQWGNDTLLGGVGGNRLEGGSGNDLLVGGADDDRLWGHEGDDVLVYDAADTILVDGGEDVDTLRIDGSGEALNLTQVADSVYLNLERIDLTGTGDNSLTLSLTDLLALGDGSNTLTVIGDAGDTVAATDGGWVSGGALDVGGIFYDSYTNDIATLLVDQDVDKTGITFF